MAVINSQNPIIFTIRQMENYVKVKQNVTLVTGALKWMNLFIV